MDFTNNTVEKMPVFRVKVYPGGLVFVTMSEDGVRDNKTMLCTFAQEEDAMGVGFSYSILPSCAIWEFQIIFDSGVEVTEEDALVLLASISVVKAWVELFFDISSIKHGGACTDGSILDAELKMEDCKTFVSAHKEIYKLADANS